jgi:saccharopine dehydrogenase-like NADP-dependent oxidoreductase
MRVLAIGGAGAMGRFACRLAVRSEAVGQLTVTDLSAEAAEGFARELGRGSVGIGLDVTDPTALERSLGQADVVLNMAGPFYRLGTRVLVAAIAAGCHYLDICDDGEPTEAMLGLDAEAAAAGVTAVLGIGASPGISNLLAVLAMRELDGTDTLVTGWSLDGARPEAPGHGPHAATLHGIRQATGRIRVLRGGVLRDEPPLRPLVVDYPGIGRRRAGTFGHPEPLTLTRTFPELRESTNVTHGDRAGIALLRSIRWAVERGLLSPERAAVWLERAGGEAPSTDPARLFPSDTLPPVFALACGRGPGGAGSVGVALAGFPAMTMSGVTGTPLVVALELLAAGALTRRGVFPAEGVVDPDAFMAAYARHCLGGPAPEQVRIVTRSWDPDVAGRYQDGVAHARARVTGS